MEVKLFERTNTQYINEAALLLENAFPQAYAGEGLKEMKKILSSHRIAVMAIDNNHLIGLVGAIPQYGTTGWELHPLVVDDKYRNRGVGRSLEAFLVSEIKKAGGVVIYLGTDDEHFRTSLSKEDLFDDPYTKMKNIKNLSNHPFSFYQKLGYIICGVIPDANGIGKPDIIMAKKVV